MSQKLLDSLIKYSGRQHPAVCRFKFMFIYHFQKLLTRHGSRRGMVSRRKKPLKKDCQCGKHGAEFSEILNHAANWIALDQREDMKLDS
jgi:hypothetical protein